MAANRLEAMRKAKKSTPATPSKEVEVKVAYEPPGLKGFANGRRQPNLLPEDFPDLDAPLPKDIDSRDHTVPLDRDESELLGLVDRAVKEHGSSWATAMKALMVAERWKLYRQEFNTFEEFAVNRLEMSRAEAYRQIDRFKVLQILSPIGDKILPESQTRELAPVLKRKGPDAVRRVWEKVEEKCLQIGDKPESSETGKPRVITAEVIREVREEIYPPEPSQRKPKPPSPTTRTKAAVALGKIVDRDDRDPDVIGRDVAGELAVEIGDLRKVRAIGEALVELGHLQAPHDPVAPPGMLY